MVGSDGGIKGREVRRIKKITIEERKKELEIKLKEITNILAKYKMQLESDEGKETLKIIKQDEKLAKEVWKEIRYIVDIVHDLLEYFVRS